MQLRALLGIATCVWISGCTVGSIDPATEDAGKASHPDSARDDDTGAFAPAADPDDASVVPADPTDTGTAPDPVEPVDSGTTTTKDTGSASPVDSGKKDTGVADTGSKVPHDSSVPPDTSAPPPDTSAPPDTSVATPDTSVVDTSVGPADTGAAATDTGPALVWRQANLTTFTSYPAPGSDECIKYSGCLYEGEFAALSSKMPESWVSANNIVAVHSKDFSTYKLKTLRLRQGTKTIDVKVYDECADSDCSGCCTANSKSTGFLIDMEKYTVARFGSDSGIVEWVCLDC